VISLQSTALLIVTVCIFILLVVMVGLIQSTLNGIYTAAVYQYANDGKVSTFFEAGLVEQAFRQK
jgi:hypothetical protein